MRDTDHFKRHVSIQTQVDNQPIEEMPVEDPFHSTTIIIQFSLWQWLTMLFWRQVKVHVSVRADGVALGRWFQGADICERCKRTRIDTPGQHPTKPGYEHGNERWCKECYYEAPVTPAAASRDNTTRRQMETDR